MEVCLAGRSNSKIVDLQVGALRWRVEERQLEMRGV